MNSYTHHFHPTQDLVDEPPFGDVEILSLADEVSNAEQADEFLTRLDDAGQQLRLRTCAAFELGHASGETAFNILLANGLLGDLDEFMTIFAAGVWALHREEFISPNDPPPDPMPEWRMLEALAEARKGRVG